MDEEGRDKCLLHVFAYRIQVLYIEIVLAKHMNTLSLIVDLTKLKAIPLNTANPPPNR